MAFRFSGSTTVQRPWLALSGELGVCSSLLSWARGGRLGPPLLNQNGQEPSRLLGKWALGPEGSSPQMCVSCQ